ncbi:MAG: DUF2273 domain-containing protein [Clostridia bacterium]|nr:DUF2273 domain-containing protein [Clostridia bacterium]
MSDREDRPSLTNIFKIGTPECAIFCCVAGVCLGLLLLTVGFWNALWIALLGAIGAFVGGAKGKKQVVKNLLNKVIPDKKTVLYRDQHPDIVKAVRDAAAKSDSEEDAEESAPDAQEQQEQQEQQEE